MDNSVLERRNNTYALVVPAGWDGYGTEAEREMSRDQPGEVNRGLITESFEGTLILRNSCSAGNKGEPFLVLDKVPSTLE